MSNKAMTLDQIFNYLEEALHHGEVKVRFLKRDGTERKMLCTLVPSYYPDYQFSVTGEYDTPSNILRVWDIVEEDWRSIRKESIKEVELVKEVPVTEDVG